MKKEFILIFLFFLGLQVFSQANQNEAIENSLKLSKEFYKKNTDSAIFFADKALFLSQKSKNDTLLAKSYIQKSNILILKRSFSLADSLLKSNLKNTLPKHIIGKTWDNIATIHLYKQEYSKSIDTYLKAASFTEQSNSKNKDEMLANIYSNIGILNASLKNFEKAKSYLEKAIRLNPEEESLRLKIESNLCTLYYDLKFYDLFKNMVFKTEALAQQLQSKRVLASIYTNLTNYYTNVETNFSKAIDYGKQSVSLKKELNFTQSLLYSYNNLGFTYLQKKEYHTAIKYLDSSLVINKNQAHPILYNNLKEAYTGLGDYKNALKYADKRNAVKDSITNQQHETKVAELLEKFESDKKQQQIDVLDAKTELQELTINQQRYWFWGLIAVAILGACILFFSFKGYKTKQKLDKVLLRQKILKTQLNPHFLFNALQSIQNFIYQNNTEKSTSYLASYSKLIRLVLENADKDLISVSEDQLAIESYLSLQQLSHKNAFTYSVIVNNNIDTEADLIPPLISQAFVENAVLHGVKDIENGHIEVNYYIKNKALYISIKDNGKGMVVKDDKQKRLHNSMSLNLIKEQFKTLSQTSNFKGDILMDFSSGTKVTLKIIS